MKAKNAHDMLIEYSGNELYQQACLLYREEAKSRIFLRAHLKPPSDNLVIGVVKEMKPWFRLVARDLAWDNPQVPEDLIKWETSAIYVRFSVIDPEIATYRKRVRSEVLKGSSRPLFQALEPGTLDAVSSMMMAQIQQSAREVDELERKRKEFAGRVGKPICPYGADERHCPHQETYSMVELLPTNTNDLVFVCVISKCDREKP